MFKKNTYNLLKKVEYNVYSEANFGGLKPLTEFLFNSYYIHNVENLVRPTELAAQIKLNQITPEQFKDFFLGNKIFQTLKKIKDFSYEQLKNDLMDYEPKIDNLLERIGENYTTLEEKVDRILELFYFNLTNWKNEKIISYIYPMGTDNPMFQYFKTPERENYLDYFFKKTGKYEDDYVSFFKDEEKFQKYTAFNLIKKLGRLYELTHKNVMKENKSIWDWESYQKIKGNNNSITNKIKRKEEILSEMINKLKLNLQ